MTKVPNPLAQKWIAALLSGKYKQGRHCLRNDHNEFCCLGVAADVLGYDMWEYAGRVASTVVEPNINGYALMSSGETDVLPIDFWLKIIEGAPFPIDQSMLADGNDNGASFETLVHEYILPMWIEELQE